MAQLALDLVTGDLALDSSGGFYSAEGLSEIRQDVWLACRIHRGELAYAVDRGVPYTDEVMAAGTPPQRITAIFRDVVRRRKGVTGFEAPPVVTFDDAVQRMAGVTFRALTDEGELKFTLPFSEGDDG